MTIIVQIQQNLEVAQQQEMQYKQQLEASNFQSKTNILIIHSV